jgi:hypothetical protein
VSNDAPPVSHAVGRSKVLGALLATVWLSGALAVSMLFRLPGQAQPAWVATALMLLLVASGAALLRLWLAQKPWQLLWDGVRWSLRQRGDETVASNEARVEVRLDLQRALLLRYSEPASRRRPVWLWVQAAGDARRWHLLRCALYSCASSMVGADFAAPTGLHAVTGRT